MDQRLLEKYWNAETTPEEEQKLLDEMDAAQGAEATYFKMIAKARQQQSKLCIDDLRMRIGQEETTVTSARTISKVDDVCCRCADLSGLNDRTVLLHPSKYPTEPGHGGDFRRSA